MSQRIEVKVPDIGDFKAVEVIEVLVKVGDVVAGQGSIKHGVFVPTTLGVLPPGAMGPRRGRRSGEAVSTAPATAPVGATPKQ